MIFTELEDYEAVEFNPCLRINNKPEINTNLHRHASEKEKELIKAFLLNKNPNFYTYLATEYLTGIRPKELFGLQVCDIDWINQCFDVKPTDGKSKTKKARKVPIPNSHLEHLESLNLEFAQPNDYIFSDNFKPGPERKRRDMATKLWKKLIKDEVGINVSLYSFKGKGGDDKRNAGVDAGAVSSGFGHSSMNMTMRYLHGEQDRINKDIIEKTPKF